MLFFLYLGYLALRRIPEPRGRAKRCAIAALIAFVDVPIVHFSVEWWRTLHQEATVFNPDLDAEIHGAMAFTLVFGVLAFTLLYVYLLDRRYRSRRSRRAARSARSSRRSPSARSGAELVDAGSAESTMTDAGYVITGWALTGVVLGGLLRATSHAAPAACTSGACPGRAATPRGEPRGRERRAIVAVGRAWSRSSRSSCSPSCCPKNVVYFRTVSEAVRAVERRAIAASASPARSCPAPCSETRDGVRVRGHRRQGDGDGRPPGDPPDLFKDGAPVVCEGRLGRRARRFDSDRILIKHGTEYEPPKVDSETPGAGRPVKAALGVLALALGTSAASLGIGTHRARPAPT